MSGREHALALIKQRENLEQEIEETYGLLKSHKVDRNDPLVSPDGYPRHDIDVATVRQLRVQLIRQENDMKALLEQIRNSLTTAFPKNGLAPSVSVSSVFTSSSPVVDASSDSHSKGPQPFCEVRSVVSNSIGDQAGLAAGDRIVKFGNATKIADLGNEVRSHMHSQSPLVVLVAKNKTEETSTIELKLVEGKSLGCHIVPL